jgi:hypothetical protein
MANRVFRGSETQFRELFRIEKHIFERLVDWLRREAGLRDTRSQTAMQKVLIFLWILAHVESQQNTAHKWQISQSTVHAVFKQLLPMFLVLHQQYVTLPADDWLDEDVEVDLRFHGFNGCIGAVDGTHINAVVPPHLTGQ